MFDNDLCLVKLSEPGLNLNGDNVDSVAVAANDPSAGQVCVVAGWGITDVSALFRWFIFPDLRSLLHYYTPFSSARLDRPLDGAPLHGGDSAGGRRVLLGLRGKRVQLGEDGVR